MNNHRSMEENIKKTCNVLSKRRVDRNASKMPFSFATPQLHEDMDHDVPSLKRNAIHSGFSQGTILLDLVKYWRN